MDVQLGAREHRGRDDERRRRREVAGNLDLVELEPVGRLNGDARLTPCDRHPGRLEHQLGVIAGRRGLDDRRLPFRVQAGEEDRGLHLRARDGKLVGDRAERSCVDPERQVTVHRLEAGTHPSERLGDPPHRADAERRVTRQLELLPVLTRQDPGQQPDERSRVRAVDGPARRHEPSQSLAEDAERVVVVLVDRDPESSDRLDRGLGVRGPAEPSDPRLSVAERSEQHGAVRDGLVSRHGDVPHEARQRLDPHASITGARTTP